MSKLRRWLVKEKAFKLIVICFAVMLFFSETAIAKTLKIGSMSPLTGDYSADGNDIVNGVRTAVAIIEAEGGVPGFDRIELSTEDSSCAPMQAVAAANKLINQKVVGVIGAYCSSSTIPVSEVLSEVDIPMITPSSTNEKVTGRGLRNIFRMTSTETETARAALGYIRGILDARSVYLIKLKTQSSQAFRFDFEKMSREFSLDFSGVQEINIQDYDGKNIFNPMGINPNQLDTDKIREAGQNFPDVVVLDIPPGPANFLIERMRSRGIKSRFLIIQPFAFWGERDLSDYSGLQGAYVVAPPLRLANMKGGKKLYKRLMRMGQEPRIHAFYAYDAAMVLLKSIQAAGTTNASRVRDEILKMEFQGVTGRIAFDQDGGRVPNLYLYRVDGRTANVVSCDPEKEKECCDYCIAKNDRCEDDCE